MDVEKKTVQIDLELDTKIVDSSKNPYQGWIDLATAVDAWRIFPRLFLSVYVFLLYYSTMWFMGLENPSLEQSGLISIIVGAGAAWFGLYVNSTSENPGKIVVQTTASPTSTSGSSYSGSASAEADYDARKY